MLSYGETQVVGCTDQVPEPPLAFTPWPVYANREGFPSAGLLPPCKLRRSAARRDFKWRSYTSREHALFS